MSKKNHFNLSNEAIVQRYDELLQRYYKAEKFYAKADFSTNQKAKKYYPELLEVVEELGDLSVLMQQRGILYEQMKMGGS